MKEVWRNIVGYEGLYQVSNWGRVKSLNYKRTGKEKLLNPTKNSIGYFHVVLCKDGKPKWFKVHRLVAQAFPELVDWTEDAKGRPFSELTVNHLNEVKTDNRVENLQWCPLERNIKYGTGIERRAKARINGKCSKPVAQKTKDGELIKVWPSAAEVQRQTGWCQQSISACCLGKLKSAYGYCWEYVEL